ncbi:DNA polymerase I [Pseudoalteromonas luteoviolacea B = ATCC 29581]|nr:DNA polymerase I [Pseudoalteromonas luteoviolacea B = ATCC 29581]
MPNPELLIIDALNLIRRIYAVEEKHTSDEKSLAIACRARVHNAVQRLLKLKSFQYGIAVFDGRNSWRHEFYPNYKASRAPMPTSLAHNLDKIASGFELAGIETYLPRDDEADDVIATLSDKAKTAKINVTIVSTDKGFLSLLHPHVAVFDYFSQQWLGDKHVREKFSLAPYQLIDYFSLVGDKTNDIPGVKGIGKQTAQSLLTEFDNVEHAINAESLELKIKNKLNAGLDDYILSHALLTLRTDIHLGISLRDLRIKT